MQNYEAATHENSIYICVTHTLYVGQCFVFPLFGIDWTVFTRLSLKWIVHYAFKTRRNLLSSSCNITETQSGHYKLLGWVFMVSTNMMSTGSDWKGNSCGLSLAPCLWSAVTRVTHAKVKYFLSTHRSQIIRLNDNENHLCFITDLNVKSLTLFF